MSLLLILAAPKVGPIGLASESDLALSLSGVALLAAGMAIEAGSALTLGSARPTEVSQEADASFALGAARPVGASTEASSDHYSCTVVSIFLLPKSCRQLLHGRIIGQILDRLIVSFYRCHLRAPVHIRAVI